MSCDAKAMLKEFCASKVAITHWYIWHEHRVEEPHALAFPTCTGMPRRTFPGVHACVHEIADRIRAVCAALPIYCAVGPPICKLIDCCGRLLLSGCCFDKPSVIAEFDRHVHRITSSVCAGKELFGGLVTYCAA